MSTLSLEELLNKFTNSLEPTRPCGKCGGTGVRKWSDGDKPCRDCKEMGFLTRPDFLVLFNAANIKNKEGKYRPRTGRPKDGGTRSDSRAYYVWRIARFNGGVDVTMPMMAELELGDDAYRPELEKLADIIAKVFYGTDKAGALRWAPLLGYMSEKDAEDFRAKNPQPMTAHPSGPAVIGDKPESERLELY